MSFDTHANLATSTVRTGPSPATTGTTLTVRSGEGARFSTPPFNATIGPAGQTLTPDNSEIVRVTAISGDDFTITRTQEGIGPRAIHAGDIIFEGITAKVITDIENAISASLVPIVDVDTNGAVSDGQVATDCSMTSGSPALTSGSAHFVPGDVGKVIAVYGAGPTTAGFVQPLSSTIIGYTSSTHVTLADNAAHNVTNSERTVWGTDNTTVLQGLIDAHVNSLGTIIQFGVGHYMVSTLALPDTTYSNIWLMGKGRNTDGTVLENWNIGNAFGLIIIGYGGAEVPELSPGADRVKNLKIGEMQLHQVKYATTSAGGQIVQSYATEDVEIFDVRIEMSSYEGIIMGGGYKSINWLVHDCYAHQVGIGGPAYSLSTAAFNLNGEDWEAYNNEVYDCGQGFEIGSRRGKLHHNILDGSTNTYSASPHDGINVGSTGTGIWSNEIYGNVVTDWPIVVGNGNGTLDRTTIRDNWLVNAGITLYSGLDSNSVTEGSPDTVIHGVSYITGNQFSYTHATLVSADTPIIIGQVGNAQSGKEEVVVEGNIIDLTGVTANTGINLVQLAGPQIKPVHFRNNVVKGGAGVLTSSGNEFQGADNTTRAMFQFETPLVIDYPWTLLIAVADTWPEEVPAYCPYSDMERYKGYASAPVDPDPNNPPSVGTYNIGAVIHHYTGHPGTNDYNWTYTASGWVVTPVAPTTALTAGRVPFVSSLKTLTDDADLTFATDTLTATKLSSTAVGVNTTPNSTAYLQVASTTTEPIAIFSKSVSNSNYVALDDMVQLQVNYAATTTGAPLTVYPRGYVSQLNYGWNGSASVAAVGTAQASTFVVDILGCGHTNNEYGVYTSAMRFDIGTGYSQSAGPVGRAWYTDFNLLGPIAVQPNLLNGINMFMNNHYNGSPSGGASAAAWFMTQKGTGGGTDANHTAANTYAIDVGVGIVGTSNNGSQQRGFTTALQIGGSGGPWAITASQFMDCINARDFDRYGLYIHDGVSGSIPLVLYGSAGGNVIMAWYNSSSVLVGQINSDGSVRSDGGFLCLGVNGNLSLGSLSSANTPFIDFNSSGNNIDYDVRLLASGGSASSGTGTLNVYANALVIDGANGNANELRLSTSGTYYFDIGRNGSTGELEISGSQQAALVMNGLLGIMASGSTPSYVLQVQQTNSDRYGYVAGQTFLLQDAVASTGKTRGIVKAGAGQSTTNLWEFQDNSANIYGSFSSNAEMYARAHVQNDAAGNRYTKSTTSPAIFWWPKVTAGTTWYVGAGSTVKIKAP